MRPSLPVREQEEIDHGALKRLVHLRPGRGLAAELPSGSHEGRHGRNGDDAADEHLGLQPGDINRQRVSGLHPGRGGVAHHVEPGGVGRTRANERPGVGKAADIKEKEFLKFGGVTAGKLNGASEQVTVIAELPDGAMSSDAAASIGSGLRLRAYRDTDPLSS